MDYSFSSSLHCDDIHRVGWALENVPLIEVDMNAVEQRELRLLQERITLRKKTEAGE